MRGGVRAKEEACVARGRCLAQRNAVVLALGDRQAIIVGLDATDEDGIAVDDEVMRGDRTGKVLLSGADIVHAVLRRDMLHRHLQFRQALAQGIEHRLDEHGLTVENIDFRRRYLAMDAERQTDLRHALQHGHGLVHVAHAAVGIGRRTGGVELDGGDEAALLALFHIVGAGMFGEIERHQRLEAITGRNGLHDAVAIGAGIRRRHHRRHQVRHDDGAAEMAARIADHALQHGAIAQVKVPVVGTTDGDLGHGGPPDRNVSRA